MPRGVALHPVVGPARQIHQLEHLLHPGGGDVRRLRQQRQIAASGEVREEQGCLHQGSNLPDDRRQLLRDRPAQEPQGAGVGLDQPQQQPDRGRLT